MLAKLQCLLFSTLCVCAMFIYLGCRVGSIAGGVENSVDNELVKEAAKGVKEGASLAYGLLKK